MRIAWDLQAVTGPRPTGLGISVGFMLDAFKANQAQYEVVGLHPNEKNLALKGVDDRLSWEQWRLPRALRSANRHKPISLCYSPALGAPLTSPVPVVAHVHDLIPLLYPQSFSGAARWYWKKMLPYTWKRCSTLTVSNQTVADDLANHLGYDPQRIHVVPYYPNPQLAAIAKRIQPDFAEVSATSDPAQPVFLTIASLEPRKNIELAIKALAVLKQRGTSARLVCIGGITPHQKELLKLAKSLGVLEQVEFAGYLEQEAIVKLLLGCTALLFVSRYEGFGMPPLEAMSLGTAVVLSDIGCHRHIYHDRERWNRAEAKPACQPKLVPVDDPGLLADEMQHLVVDHAYRAELRKAGLAYSATFSPQATAEGLCRAFNAALGQD